MRPIDAHAQMYGVASQFKVIGRFDIARNAGRNLAMPQRRD